jgi:hypothetical protein
LLVNDFTTIYLLSYCTIKNSDTWISICYNSLEFNFIKGNNMKKVIGLLLLGSAFGMSGCASMINSNVGYGGQPTGIVYAGYTTSGNIANSEVKPEKSGKACTSGILWVVAWGHSGTNDAMKASGITKVADVQYSTYSILSGLYSEYCTIVTGEQ